MRYAIYHLPSGKLGSWGNSWLGWDVRTSDELSHREIAALPHSWADLVSTPQRYGFHATIKAPFGPADGVSAETVEAALREILAKHAPFAMEMELRSDWGFAALRPKSPPPALAALEADVVTLLDPLRAPLSDSDRERRKPHLLDDGARAHLDRWGYPHVLDRFHYHLTLSGPLTPADGDALAQCLLPDLAPMIESPMPVATLALVEEGADKRFRLIAELPLGG